MDPKRCWAVILAGGNGERLRPLTSLLYHDDRPKQFCPIFSGQTLLDQTRARIARVIAPERTMFVVVRAHQRFYESQLSGVDTSRVVVQPSNKGTTPAIVLSLLRIARLDPHAIVGFFPADHFYADDSPFLAAIRSAYELAPDHHDSPILVGVPPRTPEVEYGWIEPGATLRHRPAGRLFRVHEFWEKPELPVARSLLERGCLWNTFMMIAPARAFLAMLRSMVPELVAALMRSRRLDHLYHAIKPSDFSRQVLCACKDRLCVLEAPQVDWSDLGNPRRMAAAMSRMGLELPRLASAAIAS
jgi:mannose-1-phosphate guanylyltransferase